jgi:hypothetical protein
VAEWRGPEGFSVDAVTSSEKIPPSPHVQVMDSSISSRRECSPEASFGKQFSSTREVHGQDLVNLAMYWMVRPKAYIDEVRAYIHHRNPANPLYSQSQIYCAEL